MRKEDALKTIFKCAVAYENNLADRNFLFICANSAMKISMLEVVFARGNFLHMTGVKFGEKSMISPNAFFQRCLDKRLTVNDFEPLIGVPIYYN